MPSLPHPEPSKTSTPITHFTSHTSSRTSPYRILGIRIIELRAKMSKTPREAKALPKLTTLTPAQNGKERKKPWSLPSKTTPTS